jgi:hypothetical protein
MKAALTHCKSLKTGGLHFIIAGKNFEYTSLPSTLTTNYVHPRRSLFILTALDDEYKHYCSLISYEVSQLVVSGDVN